MRLPLLSSSISLKDKRVLLRVDWNVPFQGVSGGDASLKLERTYETVRRLAARGAKVVVMTHLGRPKGRDPRWSTKRLLHQVKRGLRLPVVFLGARLDDPRELAKARIQIETADQGTVFLLENVRFLKGEEEHASALSKALASLADVFMNDAFAVSHRRHASVVGIAKYLPAYAGPTLAEEVKGLERLLEKPKHPFVAIVGGAKLSTKLDILEALLRAADKVLVGGAMAHPFFVARRLAIGKSFLEKESVTVARRLMKNSRLVLPTDAVVMSKGSGRPHVVPINKIKAGDVIGDIGTDTMMAWAATIKTAKTLVWNGPLGITEQPTLSHGSLVVACAVAARSKGGCYGVVGGGDTLPVMLQSGMAEWVDLLSTGGGAMLEFIAHKGKLVGLEALMKKRKKAVEKREAGKNNA